MREKRNDPAVLYPGEIVTIPKEPERDTLPLEAKTTNKVVAQATVEINLKFEEDGRPLASEPFVIEGLGYAVEGTSDGDGKVSFKASIHIHVVYLCFPKKQRKYPVRIGHMDPIEEHSGVYARLQHLGYASGGDSGKIGNSMAYYVALFRFQIDNGLAPTGMPDEMTRAKLVEVHGC